MKINLAINWSAVPTYNLSIKDISRPYDIITFMKYHKVKKYLYRIVYKGILIKFGMSADNSRTYGERIYRQIGHCKSWGPERLNGACGADWRVIEDDFFNLYGYHIDHQFIEIKIFDFTNYKFQLIDFYTELLIAESQLIEQYKELVGQKPIGNIHDEENIVRRPRISEDVFNSMFQ